MNKSEQSYNRSDTKLKQTETQNREILSKIAKVNILNENGWGG
jgi:hypothetical protein